MKQLPWNIGISILLLVLIFIVADHGLTPVDASTAQIPGMMIDHLGGGHVQLRGFGFRPGSLVTLTLKLRLSEVALTTVDAWVDPTGSFDADLYTGERTNMPLDARDERAVNYLTDDLVVVANTSTGSISIPVRARANAR